MNQSSATSAIKTRLLKAILLLFTFSMISGNVKAQTPCDSLDIRIRYAPFYDSVIEIGVTNRSQQVFNNPGFVIYNNNWDTVAKEKVRLFGLIRSLVNVLDIRSTLAAGNKFNGHLNLYSHFFDSLRCSYPMNFDLCPGTCVNAVVNLHSSGTLPATGGVYYQIKNGIGQVMKTGNLNLTPGKQYDQDSACLFPGVYTLYLTQSTLSQGGQNFISIGQDSITYPTPLWTYNTTQDTSFSFDFFKKCGVQTSISDTTKKVDGIAIFIRNQILEINGAPGQMLSGFKLLSIDGRVIESTTTNAEAYRYDVSALATNIYVIQVFQKGQYVYKKVSIGHF